MRVLGTIIMPSPAGRRPIGAFAHAVQTAKEATLQGRLLQFQLFDHTGFTMVGLTFLKALLALPVPLLGLALPAMAQATQTSVGLFCESVPQVERFLAIRGKPNKAALAIVNDEFDQGHRVCGIGRIEFVEISVEKKVDSWYGDWEIVKIDVQAMHMGLGPFYTKGLIRYTAFLTNRKPRI